MRKILTPPSLPLVGKIYDVDCVQQTARLEGLLEIYGM